MDNGSRQIDEAFPWKLRILIIDDHRQLVEMLQQGFTFLGQQVLGGASGQEGIDLFDQNEVDLVISDLGMPDVNGWKVGKHIKEKCEAENRKRPIFLLLTGWGDSVVNEELIRESGVDQVIKKPINIQQLLYYIKKKLKEDRGTTEKDISSNRP